MSREVLSLCFSLVDCVVPRTSWDVVAIPDVDKTTQVRYDRDHQFIKLGIGTIVRSESQGTEIKWNLLTQVVTSVSESVKYGT